MRNGIGAALATQWTLGDHGGYEPDRQLGRIDDAARREGSS